MRRFKPSSNDSFQQDFSKSFLQNDIIIKEELSFVTLKLCKLSIANQPGFVYLSMPEGKADLQELTLLSIQKVIKEISFKQTQLITPRPLPERAQPFSTCTVSIEGQQVFVYPHQKAVYLYNEKRGHQVSNYQH